MSNNCVQLCHYVHNYDVAYHFTTKTLFENKMWKCITWKMLSTKMQNIPVKAYF